jgi:hypothetical protein
MKSRMVRPDAWGRRQKKIVAAGYPIIVSSVLLLIMPVPSYPVAIKKYYFTPILAKHALILLQTPCHYASQVTCSIN